MKPSHKRLILNQNSEQGYILNAEKGLQTIKNAMSRLQNGSEEIVNICCLGDSITEGYQTGATEADLINNAYVTKLRVALAAKYGDVGQGFVPTYFHAIADTSGRQWVLAGTWTLTGTGAGGPYGSASTTSTNGSTATFTFTGTGLVLYYLTRFNYGTFTYSLDGGDPVLVNTYGETVNQSANVEITGLEEGTHTIVITKSDDTKPIYISGACPTRGTKGIRVNNISKYGTTPQKAVQFNTILEIDHWTPALTIMAWGANDYIPQTDPATFAGYIQTAITTAKQYGDVILMPLNLQTDNKAIKLNTYVDVMRRLAIVNNCCFINIYQKWCGDINYAYNQGFTVALGNVHLSAGGHDDIGDDLIRLLLP